MTNRGASGHEPPSTDPRGSSVMEQQTNQPSISQGNITISQSNCKKVFITRDYSIGCGVKFQEKLPTELEGRIDIEKFEYLVRNLNNLYAGLILNT